MYEALLRTAELPITIWLLYGYYMLYGRVCSISNGLGNVLEWMVYLSFNIKGLFWHQSNLDEVRVTHRAEREARWAES